MPRTCTLLTLLLAFATQARTQGTTYLYSGFEGGAIPPGWTVQVLPGPAAAWSVAGTGTNPPAPPFAGLRQARFNSYDALVGASARLVTARTNLAAGTSPVVEFAMYHDEEFPDAPDTLLVEATAGDSAAGPWTPLYAAPRPHPVNGWRREAVPLAGFAGSPRVYVAFRGLSRYGNNIFLDETRVTDSSFHDAGVVDLSVPGGAPAAAITPSAARAANAKHPAAAAPPGPHRVTLPAGTPAVVAAVARNFGTYAEQPLTVFWDVDGEPQAPVPGNRALPSNALDTVSLRWTPPNPGRRVLRAWTDLGTDGNRLNDTLRLVLDVLGPDVVLFEGFNGASFPPSGWSTLNADGGANPPWFRGSASSAFPPFEGAGFAADNFQSRNGTRIDDWLIGPPLTGVGQPGLHDSLVFMVRSVYYLPPAVSPPDTLLVLLSAGGQDTASFTRLLDRFAVPKPPGAWARRAYRFDQLFPPSSTVRVAFRYLHHAADVNADFVGVDAVSFVRSAVANVEEPAVPHAAGLVGCYPNPFNPGTVVRFSVRSAARVRLAVYDLLGREVTVLADGPRDAGMHEVRWEPRELGSGVYLVRMRAGEYTAVQKVMCIR